MTNYQLDQLNVLIDQSGYKRRWIYEQLGLSKEGLRKKLNGKIRFNLHEIEKLSEILGLTQSEKESLFYR